MDEAIVTALFNNAALLLVLSIILEITNQLFRKSQRLKVMICGLLISLICVAIMRMPFMIQAGMRNWRNNPDLKHRCPRKLQRHAPQAPRIPIADI